MLQQWRLAEETLKHEGIDHLGAVPSRLSMEMLLIQVIQEILYSYRPYHERSFSFVGDPLYPMYPIVVVNRGSRCDSNTKRRFAVAQRSVVDQKIAVWESVEPRQWAQEQLEPRGSYSLPSRTKLVWISRSTLRSTQRRMNDGCCPLLWSARHQAVSQSGSEEGLARDVVVDPS